MDYFFAEPEASFKDEGRQVLVLWQRDDEVTNALSRPYIADPVGDLSYLEARMWTWTWYVESKILRGELSEAVSGLTSLRNVVLFGLMAIDKGERSRGARFAEAVLGETGSAGHLGEIAA